MIFTVEDQQSQDIFVSWSCFSKITIAQITDHFECSWHEFCLALDDLHRRHVVDKCRDNFLITCAVFDGGVWQSKKYPDYRLDCPNGIRDGAHLQSCGLIGLDYDQGVLTA